MSTSKIRGTGLASQSINGYLPSEIHEENELDEAGTTHKKPSLYNYSRYNAEGGIMGSAINVDKNFNELKQTKINPSNIIYAADYEINQSSLSDIIASDNNNQHQNKSNKKSRHLVAQYTDQEKRLGA